MNRLFGQYWWLFLLRGIFGVLLGLIAFFVPGATMAVLVIFLGAYMFIEGIFSIIAAISNRKTTKNWGMSLLFGLFGIVAGIVTFYNPFATAAALIYLVAFWALIIGIGEIVWAIRLRKQIKGEGWYIFTGIISILFGLSMFFNPVAGAFTLTFLFGIYAFIVGIMLISLAMRLKKRHSVAASTDSPFNVA